MIPTLIVASDSDYGTLVDITQFSRCVQRASRSILKMASARFMEWRGNTISGLPETAELQLVPTWDGFRRPSTHGQMTKDIYPDRSKTAEKVADLASIANVRFSSHNDVVPPSKHGAFKLYDGLKLCRHASVGFVKAT